MILTICAASYFIFWNNTKESSSQISLAVADFANLTDLEELDGLSDLLITALDQSRHLNVFPRTRLLNTLQKMGKQDVSQINENIAKEICTYAKIKALASASIRKIADSYIIDLKILDVEKDEFLYTDKGQCKELVSVVDILDDLSKRARKGLKENEEQILAQSNKISDIATSNLEAHKHYFKAIELQYNRKTREAREELNNAIALDSTYGLAYFRLALIMDEIGAPEKQREETFQKAYGFVDHLPERERLLIKAIKSKREEGWEIGIAKLREMQKIYPDDLEMTFEIGDWFYNVGNFDSAEVYYTKVLDMDPTHYRALQFLTWTYEERGLYEKELKTAKRLIAIDNRVTSFYELTKASVLSKQFENGLKTLQLVRDMRPDGYKITKLIAHLYAHEEKYDKAQSELVSLLNEQSTAEQIIFGYDLMSEIYPYLGKYQNVLDALDKVIEFNWQNKDTSEAISYTIDKGLYIIWAWQDRDRAIEEISKIRHFLDRPHLDWGINNRYSLLQVYLGDYASIDSSSLYSSYRVLIHSLIQMKQDSAIVESFSSDYALKAKYNPQQIILYFHIAQCHYNLGNYDKAILSLHNLHEKYESDWTRAVFYPKSIYLLGKINEKSGDRKAAIANYEKLLDMWKEADKDLPELIDAKERLAKLMGEN